jgi:hypothetical protein
MDHGAGALSDGFHRGGYYAVIAYGHDENGKVLWSDISEIVDGSKASAGGVTMQNILATASDKQILLTWNNGAATEDGYVLERSLDGINFTALTTGNTTGADTTQYVDSDVSLGCTYTYRVKAVRLLGDGVLDSEYAYSYGTVLFT